MAYSRNFTRARFELAIATGIAGVVSLYAARVLGLPQGYWAAISAFIVLQSDIAGTLSAARNRLIGTAIGAVIGALFVRYLGAHPLWLGVDISTLYPWSNDGSHFLDARGWPCRMAPPKGNDG